MANCMLKIAGKQKRTVGFDVLTAMVMKSTLFWDIAFFFWFLELDETESTWYVAH
jgi:hypothetical protein